MSDTSLLCQLKLLKISIFNRLLDNFKIFFNKQSILNTLLKLLNL